MAATGLELQFDDLSFRIVASDTSHLVWLQEVLLPHFTLGRGPSPPVEVELIADSARYQRLRALPPAGGTLPAFVLNGAVVPLALLAGEPGHLLLANERHRVVYEVAADRRTVRVFAPEGDLLSRYGLVCVLWEYAMNHARARGDFFLHASCVVANGTPLVIAGPTGSGKTSLMLFACLHGGARFMVNDRVRVTPEAAAHLIRGVPTVVTVRPGTLASFPDVARRILAEHPSAILTSAECADGVPGPTGFDELGKRWLSPHQLSRYLETATATAAADPVVVIPRITGRPGSFALTRLDAAAAFDQLQGSFFGARNWAGSTPVFTVRPGEAGAPDLPLGKRWRDFAATCPCLLCEIGVDLYAGTAGAAAWLRALRQAAGRPCPR